jgi:UDP-N-acetylmuramate--alanine ligase
VSNALASIATARTLGIDWDVIIKALDGFGGVWRRYEKLGHCGKALVIADYAHTPDAVAKVIKATNDFYKDKKILTVFQPHQYGRTKKLFSGFVEAFDEAQKVVLPDIFYVAGRENPADFDVSSEKLGLEVALRGVEVEAPGDLVESEARIRELADDFDVILILGAGNVYEIAKNLVK